MKTQKQINIDLTKLVVALQDKVTNFVSGSVMRGILSSIAASISEIWFDLVQTKRNLLWDTARGEYLDRLAAESGMIRKGPITANVILVANAAVESGTSTDIGEGYLTDTTKTWTQNQFKIGTWVLIDSLAVEFSIDSNNENTIYVTTGTPSSGKYYVMPVIPEGTIIRSAVSGVGYTIVDRIVVGKDNPALLAQTKAICLGNRSLAVASIEGMAGAAGANTITVVSPPIPGVTNITNPVPTQPRTGLDEESDDQLRTRRRNILDILNQGTQSFYEGLAVAADENVLRAIARKDTDTGGIKVIVTSHSGLSFTDPELEAIKTYIEDNCRSFETITVVNMMLTDIFVNFKAYIRPGNTMNSVYSRTADVIANFLDYGSWNSDDDVRDDDILIEIKKVSAFRDIDLSNYSVTATKDGDPAGSGTIPLFESLPRFSRLKIINIETGEIIDEVLKNLAV